MMVVAAPPELQEYLLIDQSRYFFEHYQKVGDLVEIRCAVRQWLLTELIEENAEITLSFSGLKIKLTELYKRVDLAAL